jgi:hypothetical protein
MQWNQVVESLADLLICRLIVLGEYNHIADQVVNACQLSFAQFLVMFVLNTPMG